MSSSRVAIFKKIMLSSLGLIVNMTAGKPNFSIIANALNLADFAAAAVCPIDAHIVLIFCKNMLPGSFSIEPAKNFSNDRLRSSSDMFSIFSFRGMGTVENAVETILFLSQRL